MILIRDGEIRKSIAMFAMKVSETNCAKVISILMVTAATGMMLKR